MKRIFTTCVLLCIFSPTWAATSEAQANSSYVKKIYIGAGAGDLFVRAVNDNYIGTGPGWPNDRYTGPGATDEPYFFLAAGYTWERPSNWLPAYSLGLRYMYTSASTVKGAVYQYSLPEFYNYDYGYDVQLLNVLAVLKVDLYNWHNWMPYVMVGAGFANYATSAYTEQATSGVTPRVSPGFGANSSNNLAYNLGAGLDYAVRDNLWVNLEYNYGDYGTIKTGKGANTVTDTGTNYSNEFLENNLTSNTVLLGLTYYPG